MLRVIDIVINDHYSWEPDDLLDFVASVVINVGENNAGDNFYLQLCTPISIKNLADKHDIFIIEKWEGIEILVEKLNNFIEVKLSENAKDSDYQCLDNFWHWEYSNYK
jgi:hypothetical protein